MRELSYCTKHERLYDETEREWISFLRGEVRLVQTIYPKGDDLHFREDVCDICVVVYHRLCASVERVAPPAPERGITAHAGDVSPRFSSRLSLLRRVSA